MTFFLFIFGFIFSMIAFLIWKNKTYIPKDPGCPTDVKDAESNLTHMKVFRILGPVLIVIGIVLACFGIGIAI